MILLRLKRSFPTFCQVHSLTMCRVKADPKKMNQLTKYSIHTGKRLMSLKQLNVKIPEQELRILEAFAEKTERTKTDIIREFIRSLQTKI
jgi:Ribbon-helix-helix protein, copG family